MSAWLDAHFWVDCFHQNFLKVVVHLINIDQWSQTLRLYEIQVTGVYNCAILVAPCKEGRL